MLYWDNSSEEDITKIKIKSYEGGFKNDKRHGKGIEYGFEDGDGLKLFEGSFEKE